MTLGVETTTGPLGQGIATAVGMALAERLMNAEYGDGLVDHRTYVLASDGDLMEGVSQEAIALAGHLKLANLDRAVRRQRHLDRRAPVAVRLGRSGPALRGGRLGGGARRRARPGRDRVGARQGAGERPADADRRQDHDRLRRAEEGRHVQGARRAARRRRARRRQGGARLGAPGLPRAGRDQGGLGRGGTARPGGARSVGGTARGRVAGDPRRVRAAHPRRSAAGPARPPSAT